MGVEREHKWKVETNPKVIHLKIYTELTEIMDANVRIHIIKLILQLVQKKCKL